MEFIKLSEVAVVETANDEDKVLIEQNGEIKRVPKTEVGGSGNQLIFDFAFDDSKALTTGSANMTLDEAIAAFNNRELTGVAAYMSMQGMTVIDIVALTDATSQVGTSTMQIISAITQMQLMWTADGFAIMQ